MLHVVTTGAYYPPVVTTWKILTTGASQLTAGSLCTETTTGKRRQDCGTHLIQIGRLISQPAAASYILSHLSFGPSHHQKFHENNNLATLMACFSFIEDDKKDVAKEEKKTENK